MSQWHSALNAACCRRNRPDRQTEAETFAGADFEDAVCVSIDHKRTTHTFNIDMQINVRSYPHSLTRWRPLLPCGYSYKASCASQTGLGRHL